MHKRDGDKQIEIEDKKVLPYKMNVGAGGNVINSNW